MDADDERSELRLKLDKAERELREARANLALAESAERIAKHGRDELSAEVTRWRKVKTALTVALAPLDLLLRQLEASPGDQGAWAEAHAISDKVRDALLGEVPATDPLDAADTDPQITSPFPAPSQPFPPSPSARLPLPPKLPALPGSRPPPKKG